MFRVHLRVKSLESQESRVIAGLLHCWSDLQSKSQTVHLGKPKELEEPKRPAPKAKAGGRPPKRQKQEDVQGKKQEERLESSLANADSVKQSLVELTPEVLWKSLVRATDVERRITKANSTSRELDKLCANDKASQSHKARASQLQDELQQLVDRTTCMRHVFTAFKTGDPKVLAAEIDSGEELQKNFAACCDKVLNDFTIVLEIIQCVGKKIIEAAASNLGCKPFVCPQHSTGILNQIVRHVTYTTKY